MLYTLINGIPTPCPTDHKGMWNLRDDYWKDHGGKSLVIRARVIAATTNVNALTIAATNTF